MTYYKQIDSFRFFAAFAVLISHWLHSNPIIDRMKLGFIGVDFFFIISGFLISYQLFQLAEIVEHKEIKLSEAFKSFWVRRAFRIFPLYYTVVILATVFNDNELRDAFWYNITYTSNLYFIKTQHWTSTFSHFWSLSVEEYFYLGWPLIVLLVRRKFILLSMVLISMGALLFRYFSFTNTFDYFTVHIHTISCLDLFMFGGILAYFLKWNEIHFHAFFSNTWSKYGILTLIALSYGYVVAEPRSYVYIWVFFRTLFGIACAGLVGLLVIGFKGYTAKFLESKWLVRGGVLSYAIYLLHSFVPGMMMGIKSLEMPLAMNLLVYFVVTILLSEIVHRVVEKPLRSLGNKYRIPNLGTR